MNRPSLRLLLLAHGFPPRESAGTELHTATLAAALQQRGHEVRVLAATRAPGRAQYATWDEVVEVHGARIQVRRLVNNVPARPLAQAESDGSVDDALRALVEEVRPDLIHVHHTQFLSSTMLVLPRKVPAIFTLHDAWAWCPSGGTLLRYPEGLPCPGPEPQACARCYRLWRPVPTSVAGGLMRLAGQLAPVIPPDHLHALWKRLPARLRAPVARGRAPPEDPAGAELRAERMRTFVRSMDRLLAPSRFLAEAARDAGMGPVHVVPHGVHDLRPPPAAPGPEADLRPFLFLGTVARHKGPDLVLEAWRRAFPSGSPGLRIVGPVQEAGLVREHPLEGPVPAEQVPALLRSCRALVMGSRWPENAPLVVLEARAAGIPVVAPSLGGLPEVVAHGVDGLLYAADDPASLAAALREVVARGSWQVRPPPGVHEMVEGTLTHYEAVLDEVRGADDGREIPP